MKPHGRFFSFWGLKIFVRGCESHRRFFAFRNEKNNCQGWPTPTSRMLAPAGGSRVFAFWGDKNNYLCGSHRVAPDIFFFKSVKPVWSHTGIFLLKINSQRRVASRTGVFLLEIIVRGISHQKYTHCEQTVVFYNTQTYEKPTNRVHFHRYRCVCSPPQRRLLHAY